MVKKIDFHIHTVSSHKDYDFSYSPEWLKKYVRAAELDAIAITNHDLFDESNFKQIQYDLPNTKVFPGIELSLEEGHVNIIFPEEDSPNLVHFSEWLSTQNLGQNGKVSTEDFCTHMSNWENGIYIFELGKSNALSVPEKLESICSVGGVANQLNCLMDKTKVGINLRYLRDVIDIENHTVSTGLNLIVGKRGTGKTNFLETIKKYYDYEDIYEIAQFETSNANDFIKKQRTEQGKNALDIWKKRYDTQFSAIQDYLKNNEEDFNQDVEKFVESVKQFAKDSTTSNSTSKYQLIKESNLEEISTKNLETHLHKLLDLINSPDLWELLSNSVEKRRVFVETYSEVRNLFVQKQQNNKVREKVNDILGSVKKIVQSKTGITPVVDCEFSKIIQKHQIEKEINNFMQKIICNTELKKEKIYGYQIIVKLSPFINATQFRKDRTSEAVQDDLIVPYKSGQYITFLRNLKKRSFFNPSILEEYLLHLEVNLLDSDGVPASGGQAVGFALMMRLEEAKTKPIILIDEPEASLDNEYIRKELRDAIRNLSASSTVFVVTHNSTLGALLEPDYLIVTTKDKEKGYRVLTGEFSSHLISTKSDTTESSYEKFVEAMEAGIETYKKKGEIYESLNS